MKPRFRIQRPDGEERVGDADELRRRVQAGEIHPSDLLYDTLTGEWAPARSHPAFLDARDDASGDGVTGTEDESPPDRPEDPSTDADDGPEDAAGDDVMELQLVDEEAPAPEEAAATFIARMERERRDDQGSRREGDGEPFVFEGLAPNLGSSPAAGPPPEETPPAAGPAERKDRGPAGPATPAQPATPARSASGSPSPPRTPAADPSRDVRVGPVLVLGTGLAAILVAGLLLVPWITGSDGRDAPAPGSTEVVAAPPPGDAELAARADAAFLDSLEQLRRSFRLGPVPEEWLSGRYLASASVYPGVAAFWEGYAEYVESALDSETELYREAFLTVLRGAEVEGPMRTLKLRRGLSAFAAEAPDRHLVFQRSLELAAAARELHDFLVANEERIAYEPARGERLSADPVTEAAATDPATQAELDAALDRVLAALDGVERRQQAVVGGEPSWLIRMLAEG